MTIESKKSISKKSASSAIGSPNQSAHEIIVRAKAGKDIHSEKQKAAVLWEQAKSLFDGYHKNRYRILVLQTLGGLLSYQRLYFAATIESTGLFIRSASSFRMARLIRIRLFQIFLASRASCRWRSICGMVIFANSERRRSLFELRKAKRNLIIGLCRGRRKPLT